MDKVRFGRRKPLLVGVASRKTSRLQKQRPIPPVEGQIDFTRFMIDLFTDSDRAFEPPGEAL